MAESIVDKSKRTQAMASMFVNEELVEGASEEQVSDTPLSGSGGIILSSVKYEEHQRQFYQQEPHGQMSTTELIMSGITSSDNMQQQQPQRQMSATELMMSGITSSDNMMHTPPRHDDERNYVERAKSTARQPTTTELMMSGISVAPIEEPLLGPTSMVADGGSNPAGLCLFGRPYPFVIGGYPTPAAEIFLSGAL